MTLARFGRSRRPGSLAALVVCSCSLFGLSIASAGARVSTHAVGATVSAAFQGSGRVTGAVVNCVGCDSFDCPGKCQALNVPIGSQFTFNAIPSPGNYLSDWAGSCAGNTPTCTQTINGDTRVVAFFQAGPTLSVQVSGSGTVSGGQISCPSACAQSFPKGSSVTLTAAPSSGNAFSGWGGACSGTASTCTVPMDVDKSVTASFQGNSAPDRSLKVQVAGSGTVSGGLINCPPACAQIFANGSPVTLTATAPAGVTFTGWGGACAGAGTAAICKLTMDADKSVTASFLGKGVPDRALRVAVTGSGSVSGGLIDCPTACSQTFADASSVKLTAIPDAGFFFFGWSGACSGTAATCTLQFDSDKSVTADFERNPVLGDATAPQLPPLLPPQQDSLSVSVSGNGSVTSASTAGAQRTTQRSSPAKIRCGLNGYECFATFAPDDHVTLAPEPAPGWAFKGWSDVVHGHIRSITANFAPRAAGGAAVTDSLERPRFQVQWRRSVGRGKLFVSGTVAKPAVIRLQLRRPHGGPLLTEDLSVPPGRFIRSPSLLPGALAGGAHLFPGGFVISLTGRSGRVPLPLQLATIVLPAPPEGVVRRAFASRTTGGSPLTKVPASSHEAWANFDFEVQPIATRRVTVAWYWPNGRLLGTIDKSNRPLVTSFLRNRGELPRGNWRVELRAGNKVIATLRVPIR